MSKIQTKISIRSRERVTLKRKRYSMLAWCDTCAKTSIMALPSEAAFLACQDVDSIIYLMYANRLHVRHVASKGLFVCLASLCSQTFDSKLEKTNYNNELLKIDVGNYDYIFEE